MNFFCIADEDTVRGFQLAGVSGKAVANASEAADALTKAAADPECAIVILTDAVAARIRKQVDGIRLEQDHPLIVEIPGPTGPLAGQKNLQQLVREAVGIHVE
jgi:vacuolar-type H+-ATPase subunit F/Vma7